MTISTRQEATDPLLVAVKTARRNLQEFQEEFDRQIALEREEKSASLKYAIDQAVVYAYKSGRSKSAIGRAYNTRDSRTIKNILDAQMSLHNEVTAVTAMFDDDSQVLTLTLNGAVLEGMAAAKGEPVTGTWDFHRTEMGNRLVWASTKAVGKGPFEIQMAAWLNSSEDNVLRKALTDAGIDDIVKSAQPTTTAAFDLTI